ncbi:MAG: hypothetical protein PHT40_04625 [Patescibacteria group bacterium]|nr:hypothetical protein [Patescibacteria group bacterium]
MEKVKENRWRHDLKLAKNILIFIVLLPVWLYATYRMGKIIADR